MVLPAVKVWLKATFTVPVLVTGLVTVMIWQLMFKGYVTPSPEQPCESGARTTIGNEPFCVGVPERTPVGGLSVRPAGSGPLASEKGGVPTPPTGGGGWLEARVT